MTPPGIKDKKISRLFCVLFSVSLALLPMTMRAASFNVTPAIIDLKARARDILKESITLTNNTDRKLNVYAFVNNVAVQEGKQEFLDPSRTNQASSLANWILFPRGVIEISPGEKKSVDFKIEVNLRASPGIYHAVISFVDAPTRDDAEAKAVGAPSVAVNLEIAEDVKEWLQLKRFVPDKTFFSGFPVSFSYELENTGNKSATPSGEIRIYNRRGKEVASLKINEKLAEIGPEKNLNLANLWRGSDAPESGRFFANASQGLTSMGKYKAFLDLQYGSKQRASLQDTVFFWVIPWQYILAIFGALLALIICLIFLWHRR